jgi:hypothetical protein
MLGSAASCPETFLRERCNGQGRQAKVNIPLLRQTGSILTRLCASVVGRSTSIAPCRPGLAQAGARKRSADFWSNVVGAGHYFNTLETDLGSSLWRDETRKPSKRRTFAALKTSPHDLLSARENGLRLQRVDVTYNLTGKDVGNIDVK